MKVPLAIFFVFLGCAMVIQGVPTPSEKDPDPSKDVELIPHSTYGDQPIVDTGFGWSTPFSNPFGGLFENIESIMTKMRQQMEEVMKRFPSVYGGNGTDFTFNEGLPDNIDPSKVNTTSVTKIIDGHKVIINDTEYKNSDAHGGSFFHVRVIDVKPNSDDLPSSSEEVNASKSPAVTKDRESIENSLENEIVKDKESSSRKQKRYANLETLDYVDPINNDIDNNIEVISRGWNEPSEKRFVVPQPWLPYGISFPRGSFGSQEIRYGQPGFQTLFPQPNLVDNRWQQSIYSQNKYPQSNYLQVSDPQLGYLQQNRYQMGFIQDRFPQTGYIQNTYPQSDITQNRYPQPNMPQNRYPLITSPQNWNSQTNGPQNWSPTPSTAQNRFYTTVSPQDRYPQRLTQTAVPPFDLSRDTYVNDIMAQSGAPTNPDAEVFDVNSLPVQNSNSRFRYPR